MPARPASHKTVERRFKQHGRELAAAAADEKAKAKYEPALKLALLELEQQHSHKGKADCQMPPTDLGNGHFCCPCGEAILAIRKTGVTNET